MLWPLKPALRASSGRTIIAGERVRRDLMHTIGTKQGRKAGGSLSVAVAARVSRAYGERREEGLATCEPKLALRLSPSRSTAAKLKRQRCSFAVPSLSPSEALWLAGSALRRTKSCRPDLTLDRAMSPSRVLTAILEATEPYSVSQASLYWIHVHSKRITHAPTE